MYTSDLKTDSGVGYRIASLLAAIVAALAIVLIPFQAVTAAAQAPESLSLLDIILKAVNGGHTALGFLPAFDLPGAIGIVYNVSMYIFAACLATSAVIGIIGLCSGKGTIARTSACFLFIGAAVYTISANLICASFTADLLSLAIALVAAVMYLIMSLTNIGKIAWLHFLQFVLSMAFVLCICRPLGASESFKEEPLRTLPMIAFYLGLVVVFANTVVALARISRKGGIIADLVRFIIVLLSALLVTLAAADNNILWSLLSVAVATLQIVIVIIVLVKSNKKAVETAAKEAGEAAVAGFRTEEYAEAYAYEGGPVSGVLMAEEVNPSFLPHEPHVNTAGYDFYNSKSFDPFIATLDANERNEFTETFILKFKGTMPELPDYEVGGDNKEFFRKIFIYLGQYRDRISQPLLMKMYQFSMKI